MRKLLYLPCLILAFSACKKNNDTSKPPDTPSTINITMPGAGNIYNNGSQLSVRGDVNDNNALANVKFEVRNATTNAVLYQQNNTTGNVLFYVLAFDWTVTGITGPTNAIVRITSTDRYDYVVSKDVAITLVD